MAIANNYRSYLGNQILDEVLKLSLKHEIRGLGYYKRGGAGWDIGLMGWVYKGVRGEEILD